MMLESRLPRSSWFPFSQVRNEALGRWFDFEFIFTMSTQEATEGLKRGSVDRKVAEAKRISENEKRKK